MTSSLVSNPDSSLTKSIGWNENLHDSPAELEGHAQNQRANFQECEEHFDGNKETQKHGRWAGNMKFEPMKEWESNLQEGTLKPGRKHPSQPSISTWGQRPLWQRKASCSVENGCATGHLGAGGGTLSSGGYSDSRETGSEILHRQDLPTRQVTDRLDHERC